MKKYTFPILFATALVAAGCSNDDNINNDEIDETGKSLISFAAENDGMAVTRAGFTAETKIVAHFVSNPRTGAPGGSANEYTRAILTGQAESDGFSKVDYTDKKKYWDDAHGRYSQLSVYAVTVPNKTSAKLDAVTGDDSWSTSAVSNTIAWSVSADQTGTKIYDEDLAFSNNIRQDGNNGVYIYDFSAGKYPELTPLNATKHSKTVDGTTTSDGRMIFSQNNVAFDAAPTTDAGHFDKGHMEFKHALTRVNVVIQKGEGYTSGFAFKTNTNVQFNKAIISGTFDYSTDTWTSKATGDITKMLPADTYTDAAGTYQSQMLPGFALSSTGTSNDIEFTIDDNTYYVTNAQLFNALKTMDPCPMANDATSYNLLEGYRYTFTIVVGKTKIDNITAKLVAWDEINAKETTVNNAHINFTFGTNGTGSFSELNLYKHEETLENLITLPTDEYTGNGWSGNYTGPATLTEKTTGKYTTDWFYENNKTAYHLRMINNLAKTGLATNNPSFAMESGAPSAKDYQWGAPMKSDADFVYSPSTGYAGSLQKGLVANNSTDVHITGFHMMSELVVNLKTPSDGSGVNLTDATVSLTYFYANGSVDMGTGKVTTTGELYSSMALGATATDNQFALAVIPQSLVRASGDHLYVGITIHTTDNNEYYIIEDLSKINVDGTSSAITEWLSGKRYTYTFNVTKTKIDNITATIADWINIKAADKNVSLED